MSEARSITIFAPLVPIICLIQLPCLPTSLGAIGAATANLMVVAERLRALRIISEMSRTASAMLAVLPETSTHLSSPRSVFSQLIRAPLVCSSCLTLLPPLPTSPGMSWLGTSKVVESPPLSAIRCRFSGGSKSPILHEEAEDFIIFN